jgi:hypothetical protein
MAPIYSKYAAPPSTTREHYSAAPPIQLQHPCCVEWNSGTSYLSLNAWQSWGAMTLQHTQ